MADAHAHPEDELLLSAERWAPADGERWERWRESLSPEDRAEALFPLQAVLAGLVAFRDSANQPADAASSDFRPHLRAVREALSWAVDLVGHLHREAPRERHLALTGAHSHDPGAALVELADALTEATRLSDRLFSLPTIDEGVFHASCDVFLHELERNVFFRPPEPLEFSNARELVRRQSVPPTRGSWSSTAARLTSWVSLLALIRSHRYLGIADGQFVEEHGLERAHVVVATVRRELRMWATFLMEQGVDAFADELRAQGCDDQQLDELRQSVEALAMGVHAKAHATLDEPLPEPESALSPALLAERMRSGIRELRAALKDAAKALRELGRPDRGERSRRTSERLQKTLHQDVWGFRFILRGFIAKASVAPLGEDEQIETAHTRFVSEFLGHFRLFAPRLCRATSYARQDALIRAATALDEAGPVEAEALAAAVRECSSFVEHLDRALEAMPHSLLAPFDKAKAAAELRGYLAAAREQKHAI